MKGNFCAVGTRRVTSLFSWANITVRVTGIKETAAWLVRDHQGRENHRGKDGGMTILIKYLRKDLNEMTEQAMKPLKRALAVGEHSLWRLGMEISRFEAHQVYVVRLELFWVCDRSVFKDKSKVRLKDLYATVKT